MKNPLQQELDQLENYLAMGDLQKPGVSEQGIYWHVDHSLRILEGIPEIMRKSKKEDYQPKSSLMKWVIMITGWIPRGKGKSPKDVLPVKSELRKEIIQARADHAFHQVNSVNHMPEWAHMRHPLFGSLKRDEAVKFMKIHTHHHLKILQDIAKQ